MANRGQLRGAKLRPLRVLHEKANPRVTWGRKATGPRKRIAGLPWLLVVDESLDALTSLGGAFHEKIIFT